MSKYNCKKCGKDVDWVAEVNIYPQKTDPLLEDYYTKLCYNCLSRICDDEEVKRRMHHGKKRIR